VKDAPSTNLGSVVRELDKLAQTPPWEGVFDPGELGDIPALYAAAELLCAWRSDIQTGEWKPTVHQVGQDLQGVIERLQKLSKLLYNHPELFAGLLGIPELPWDDVTEVAERPCSECVHGNLSDQVDAKRPNCPILRGRPLCWRSRFGFDREKVREAYRELPK
jgi:hypothetical protein